MSVATAIDKLGWSQSKISRLEKGDTPYDQDDLEVAAEVYRCAPFELITRDPNDESGRGYLHGLLARVDDSQLAYLRGVLETAANLAPVTPASNPDIDPASIDIEAVVMPALNALNLDDTGINTVLAAIETAMESSLGTRLTQRDVRDLPSTSKPRHESSSSQQRPVPRPARLR